MVQWKFGGSQPWTPLQPFLSLAVGATHRPPHSVFATLFEVFKLEELLGHLV